METKEVIRFEKIEKSDPERKKKLEKQFDQWEKGAKEGKVMCLSDILGNAGL